MFELFREIQSLIAAGGVHVRSGRGVNETSDDLLMCLLYREVAELDAARMPHRQVSELDEMGDVMTVIMRIAIRKGWHLDQIEQAGLAKLKLRYVVPGASPGPARIEPGRDILAPLPASGDLQTNSGGLLRPENGKRPGNDGAVFDGSVSAPRNDGHAIVVKVEASAEDQNTSGDTVRPFEAAHSPGSALASVPIAGPPEQASGDLAGAIDGAALIATERKRQVSEEGWTLEHDAEHDDGALVWAAICYARASTLAAYRSFFPPSEWPWQPKWWKPSKDRIRNLVKAGALIAAEIDRLAAEIILVDAGAPADRQCLTFFGGYQPIPIRCALPSGHPITPEAEFTHAGFGSAGELVVFGGFGGFHSNSTAAPVPMEGVRTEPGAAVSGTPEASSGS